MLQEWYDLLFVHYPLEPSDVQALLPEGLTVDTYPDSNGAERAWIGVVPFGMRNIRPVGLPAFPWISSFLETNVRTYVHRDGKDPGVWFFSLDAARWLACWYARRRFLLPYFHAEMSLFADGIKRRYTKKRKCDDGPSLNAEYEIGLPLQGDFETWLVERYRLYSLANEGLMSGMVHHEPYPLFTVKLAQFETDLPQACGLPIAPWEHACYSPGVKVEVYGLKPVITVEERFAT